jgi:hypothetical protein
MVIIPGRPGKCTIPRHNVFILETAQNPEMMGVDGKEGMLKLHADGSVECHKGRIVAKGYSQRPGFDYTEVFAPTFHPASLHLIIALAAKEGFKMHSVDISSAFTYGDLEEEIYMCQPEGYHQGGPNIVCKLNKSLYGLKQSARQ